MNPRPGELEYLLSELYATTVNIPLTEENLFLNHNYQHLLVLQQPWYALAAIIDRMNEPAMRMRLRFLETPYIHDFISHQIAQVNLFTRDNTAQLEKAMFLLGLLHNPSYSEEDFCYHLDLIEKRIRENMKLTSTDIEKTAEVMLSDNVTVTEKLKTRPEVEHALFHINYVLYDVMMLEGERGTYHDRTSHIIQNFFHGHRRGVPLALSTLYLILAQRLKLPIYGVNLPRHFLLKFEVPGLDLFIDPHARGNLIYQGAIFQMLSRQTYPMNPRFLEACSFDAIVKRKIANLIAVYRRNGEADHINFLEKLSRELT